MTLFGSMSGRSTSKFNTIVNYLSQKVVDAETQGKQIFDSGEDNLPENIDTFDITQIRDLGLRSTLKNAGTTYRMVEGADGKDLRCWVKFCNAGKLYDYSRNNLQSSVYGLRQIPILNMKKVTDNVLGWEFQSFFNGNDQYAYTDDHDKIRISEMFDNEDVTHISFFDSFRPVSLSTQNATETSVLFEKIDDDQLKDGYACTFNDKGDLFFYVRRNFKQYSLFLKGVYAEEVQDELINVGDFTASNFSDKNYFTDRDYVTSLICSTIKTDDHWFVFDKSDNSIKHILNGIDVTPTGLSVSPILDVPFQDGAYNTDGTDRTEINDLLGNNGTLTNPENGQWQTNNTFFSFGGNTAGDGGGCEITFPTMSEIDSATELTISLMYKPDSILNTKSYFTRLVSKNWANNSSFVLWRPNNTNNLRFTFKNSSGTDNNLTFTNAFPQTDKWYSIIVKLKDGQVPELLVDGASVSGSTAISDISTGTTSPLQLFDDDKGARGTICYFRVFDSVLGANDTQLLIDEGYHNPTFPKAEKPQPEPVETPPPVTNPFLVFYNLASSSSTPTTANSVRLNALQADSDFLEVYSVADGEDQSDPETLIYDVSDGSSTGSEDPFAEQYRFDTPSGNSSVQCSTSDNDAGGIEVQSGHALIGKKITRAFFYLKAESTPTGSVYCRIWDASGNIKVTLDYWNGSTLGTLNASSVTGDWVAYEFRNTIFNWGSSSIQDGWVIGIEYHASSGGDTIHIRRDTSNPKANVVQASRNYDSSSFSSNSSNDVACILYSGGGTTATDPFIYMQYASLSPYDRVVQKFGTGDPCVGNIPTKVKVKLKRTGTCNGTIHVYLVTAYNGTAKAEFGSGISASSISTTTTEYTFTNLTNTESIVANYVIMVHWEGLTSSSTGTIGVLTNSGVTDPHPPTGSNTISYVSKYGGFSLTNYTTLDMSGQIYKGGNDFDADLPFTTTRTRIYVKCVTSASDIYNKKLTRFTARAKRVGSATGLLTCNCRVNGSDAVKFTLGTVDASTIGTSAYEDITFTNVFNDQAVGLNDRICIEYLGADATKYIELNVNKDVLNTTATIGGTYSAPSNTDNAQIDIAGKMYTGGTPDVNSRIRCGQKIAVDNDSIMDGRKLTKIGVWLANPGGGLGNINCIVYRGTDDSPIVTIGDPVAASGIGSTYEFVEFENVNNGYVLNVNDVVAIVYEGGSAAAPLYVHVRDGAGYDGNNSHIVRYNGEEYDSMLTYDLAATMWTGGDTYQPPAGTQPDPTPTNNKALLYCAGNNILSGFARVLQREFMIYAKEITEQMALNKYENRYSITTRSRTEVLTAGLYRPY
ncbi:MAG: LamG-like jellyroll fold domain-containing protein [Candidatus Nitrosocosmicus sp.]|nr:hypothetical protein [Candidatus Nitrosocosmicus sp.]